MKIIYKKLNNILYIGIAGELDEAVAQNARDTLDTLIEEPHIKKVMLDMSELVFMDSTGIGVLLGRFKKLKARGVPLHIANPTKAVDKLLTLCGIYQYMPKVSF